MATDYLVKLAVQLQPIEKPWVRVSAGPISYVQQLIDAKLFEFEFQAQNTASLIIEHFDKDDLDPVTAVEIKSISFFGIEDPKFIWAGIYKPRYPSHLQGSNAVLSGHGYLSWNGIYSLDFTLPIFTWIHQQQNLGWIYS